jgi:hypothetical protein
VLAGPSTAIKYTAMAVKREGVVMPVFISTLETLVGRLDWKVLAIADYSQGMVRLLLQLVLTLLDTPTHRSKNRNSGQILL